ncbi:MAG: response regulator [Bacteroidaceae bacterium]|nr:response regulator [Bacteroidaceae bacterium]
MGNRNMLDTDLSQYTVMVVDDIALNIMLVQKMLVRYNFKVVTASNGAEAMEMVRTEKPNLMLLDLMMPVMDGYEVIRRIKSDPQMSSVRIVVLSALNTNGNVVKALNMGADEFITKPITMDKLYASVNAQFEMIRAIEADERG